MSAEPIPPIDWGLYNEGPPEFGFPVPEDGDVEVPMLNRKAKRKLMRSVKQKSGSFRKVKTRRRKR